MTVRFHDAFCGAGGTTLGAIRAGAEPVLGLNHWQIACQSYAHNHAPSGADVLCADVCTIDPRRLPTADLFLASPECTHHSYARGRPKDDPSLFDPNGDQGAERSRATMWDVPRFAEFHDYRVVIVENVEAAIKWGQPKGRKLAHGSYGPLFGAWLGAMAALDYEHQLVHLNALVCGVPQSRDRLFVVFWKKGTRKPDLDIPALGWCDSCERIASGHQVWKRPGAVTGTLGASYYYACPDCHGELALAVRPAAAAIDWSIEAPLIGERKTPLADGTMSRIQRGLVRLGERPMVVPVTRLRDTSQRCRDALLQELPALSTQQEQGLVVQVGAHLFERPGYTRAWSVQSDPLMAICGTADRALVVSNMTNNVPKRAGDEPMGTVTTGDKLYLLDAPDAVVTELRGAPDRPGGTNRWKRVEAEGLGAISAQGNHHGLLVANYGSADGPANKQGWTRHVDDEPMGTVTSRDSHALVVYRGKGQAVHPTTSPAPTIATVEQHALVENPERAAIDIEQCGFRMLEPDELKRGQAFPTEYLLHGTKRQQVMQIGNAVASNCEEVLVERVIACLDEAA
jgi:DNA (cytosine-5)-methyltransferase 1